MSTEAAVALLARLKTDVAFRERILAAGDARERLDLIAAEGYACAAQEIEALAPTALDESALSGVVGGAGVHPGCAEDPDYLQPPCGAFCSED